MVSMQIFVLTLFPQLIDSFLKFGIIKKSIAENLIGIKPINIRDFSSDGYVDDTSYGGGPGMVIKADPVRLAIESIKLSKTKRNKVLLVSPQGKRLDDKRIKKLANFDNLILIAGRYEGFDERISHLIDEEVSLCDFVTNGGEIPSLALIEGIVRYVPGVLGDVESLISESFRDSLLDHPHYTKPKSWKGMSVPEVLTSGNHSAIEKWRREYRLIQTFLKRPDLLVLDMLSETDRTILDRYFSEINN